MESVAVARASGGVLLSYGPKLFTLTYTTGAAIRPGYCTSGDTIPASGRFSGMVVFVGYYSAVPALGYYSAVPGYCIVVPSSTRVVPKVTIGKKGGL